MAQTLNVATSGELPQNIEAEAGVLGSILIDGEALALVADIVAPDDFYRDAHRLIYRAALDLLARGQAVDYLTLTAELEARGQLPEVGGSAYLAELVTHVPTSANAVHYAALVARLARRRRLILAGSEIAAIAYQESDDTVALEKAEALLYRLGQSSVGTSELEPVRGPIARFVDIIDELHDPANQGLRGHIVTGFRDLDRLLNGFEPGALTVLAARPAMGKSSLALSIAHQAALEQGATIALFSLEMGKEQLAQRLIAMEGRINLQRLRAGQLDDTEMERLSYALGVLTEAPIYLDDSALLNMAQLRRKCRRLQAEHGLDLVIVDYLQLMHSGDSLLAHPGRWRGPENRVQEVSEISRGLKTLAKELHVPVLALSQLSRAVESRQTRVPQLADLRESGSIEQDADVVLFIYREDVYNPDTDRKNIADVIVAKHRNGPTGQVQLFFRKEYTRFYDLATS
jgi:replicative DNA helicase